MNNHCPLGLECVTDESAPFHRKDCCANLHTCYTWITEWELPYRCDYSHCWDYNYLIVSFLENYNNLQNDLSENQITSQYDWRKYFAEYGFAEAVDLPYYFREDGAMIVSIDNTSMCREEIHKVGYANAIVLPLQRRKEFYSADTYEGFSYQEVDLFYCGDEAINALNAGYADAISLLPVSLNEQRCFYN